MAGRAKGKEVALQAEIETQEEWEEAISKEGLTVVDVYQEWCGPCKAMLSNFKRIKNEAGDELLRFVVAKADGIEALERYRGKCEPCFLFYASGVLVHVIHGASSPQLMRSITEQLAHEHKVLEGTAERKEVWDPKFPRIAVHGKKEVHAAEDAMDEEEDYEESSSDEDELSDGEKDALRNDEGEMVMGGERVNYMNMPGKARRNKKDKVFLSKQHTVAAFLPDLVSNEKVPDILAKLNEAGYELVQSIERELTNEEAVEIFEPLKERPTYAGLLKYAVSGPSTIVSVSKGHLGDNVVEDFCALVGPPDMLDIKDKHPTSLRAQFRVTSNKASDGFYCSTTPEMAARDIRLFFPDLVGRKVSLTHAPPPAKKPRTLGIVTSAALAQYGADEIVKKINQQGLIVQQQKVVEISHEKAMQFYKKRTSDHSYNDLVASISSGPILVMLIVKEGGGEVAAAFNTALGPKDNDLARSQAKCLRSMFKVTGLHVAPIHGSEDAKTGNREVNFFFPMEECLMIIKPDAQEKRDEIIGRIRKAEFNLIAMRDVQLNASEIADLYSCCAKEPFYPELVELMSSGVSTLLCLTKNDCVSILRQMVGPTDPEVCRKDFPDTLRALYGTDRLHNAIHVSSTAADAKSDIAKIFGVMDYDAEGLMLKRRRPKKKLGEIEDDQAVMPPKDPIDKLSQEEDSLEHGGESADQQDEGGDDDEDDALGFDESNVNGEETITGEDGVPAMRSASGRSKKSKKSKGSRPQTANNQEFDESAVGVLDADGEEQASQAALEEGGRPATGTTGERPASGPGRGGGAVSSEGGNADGGEGGGPDGVQGGSADGAEGGGAAGAENSEANPEGDPADTVGNLALGDDAEVAGGEGGEAEGAGAQDDAVENFTEDEVTKE